MNNWIIAFILINVMWFLVLEFREDKHADTFLWIINKTPEEFMALKREWERYRDECGVR